MNLRSVAAIRSPLAHGRPQNAGVTKTSEASRTSGEAVSSALGGGESKTPGGAVSNKADGGDSWSGLSASSSGMDLTIHVLRPQLRIVRDELTLSRQLSSRRESRVPSPKLDRTLRSLIKASQLGDNRVLEVQTRIRDGYYARPEVAMQVAGTLGKVLTTGA